MTRRWNFALRRQATSSGSLRVNGRYHVSEATLEETRTHLDIDEIPWFLSRCGVTRGLLDFVIQSRLSMSSGRMAEDIKRKPH